MTFCGWRRQDEKYYQIIHLLLLVYACGICSAMLNRLGGEYMNDYENAILARQEYSGDDCLSCEFAGIDTCNNQCMEVEEVYNPNLISLIQQK